MTEDEAGRPYSGPAPDLHTNASKPNPPARRRPEAVVHMGLEETPWISMWAESKEDEERLRLWLRGSAIEAVRQRLDWLEAWAADEAA